MKVIQDSLTLSTQGYNDIVDVTSRVREGLDKTGLREGQVTLFVPGATAGITTIEYEPGLLKDLPEALDRVAPMNSRYHHDAAWGDGNGYAHLRAALIGPSLTVPFTQGRLILGTWQQIVVIDFDNRARQRKVSLQYLGE